jgi:HemY protein
MRIWWRWICGLLFFLAVGSAGAWIAAHPGHIQLDMMGYRILVPLWLLTSLLLLLVILCCMSVWGWMRMRLWRMQRKDKRHVTQHQQGLSHVTKLLSALSSGDDQAAQKEWQHCRKTLGESHPLVQLCGLHVAVKTGESGMMRSHLLSLQDHPETQFLAHSTLMKEALHHENRAEALTHAKAAYAADPHHAAHVINYIGLLLIMQDTATALIILKAQKGRRSALNSATLQKLEAIIYLIDYQQQGGEASLQCAFTLAPYFPPAYGAITELLQHNDSHKAWRALQRAWKVCPHLELTEILLHYFDHLPKEKFLKYATTLREMHPEAIESHVMMAEVALRVQDYPLARNHLKAALAIAPQQRVYQLLARLEEEGHQDEKAAKSWLHKLHQAEPDPAWSCKACGQPHAHWQLICDGCHSFMTSEFGVMHPSAKLVASLPSFKM